MTITESFGPKPSSPLSVNYSGLTVVSVKQGLFHTSAIHQHRIWYCKHL